MALFHMTEKLLVELQVGEWGISIVQGYENRDGDFKPEFCMKRNFKTKEMDKLAPLSVFLGKDEAKVVEFARFIIEELTGGYDLPHDAERKTLTDDDIPF